VSTKKAILALLESKRGHSLSGEGIAQQLGVTRAAVWKAIKDLEKEGHKIEAVTNKGYLLCDDSDILSVEGMMPFLPQSMAGRVFVYESLESTNKTAKERAVEGERHGTVIIADSQTVGRGRYDRKFHSPAGSGIYMSLILRPAELGFNTPTLITLFAAVCVCEAIETVAGKAPQIKWVNDVFLNGKKICGILTEAISDLESGNVDWAVIGIGINITTTNFPSELQPIATSIFSKNPQTVDTTFRFRLAAGLINFFLSSNFSTDEIEIEYEKRQIVNHFRNNG